MLRIYVVDSGIKAIIGNTLKKVLGVRGKSVDHVEKLLVARGTSILHGVEHRVTGLATTLAIRGF